MTSSRRPLQARWRAVRVGALGSASLLLATTAHRFGGGALPGVGTLVVTAIALGLVGVLITGARCRLPLVGTVLAGEQFALHLVFAAGAGPQACTAAGSGHHAAMACAPDMAMTASAGWGMWLGHALAVLATAWLLTCGETWLWRAAERVSAALGRGVRRLPARRRAVSVFVARAVAPVRTFRPAAPRGPPVLV